MPRPEPPHEISRRYRKFAPTLRSVLSHGRQLDDVLCGTIDKLQRTDPLRRVQSVLSQLRAHARQSSKYHGELKALMRSMAAELAETLGELPLAEEVDTVAAKDIMQSMQNRKRLRLAPDWTDLPLVPLREILSNLCASDAAVFLRATGIQKNVAYDDISPFLEYHRDLPLAWSAVIKSHISHGHKILLVGRDIKKLHMRIHSPLKYWQAGRGKKTLQLWLATRIAPEAFLRLAQERQSNPNATFYVHNDGRVEWKSEGGESVLSIFSLFEGSLQPAHSAWTNWQTYDTDNRIRLLCQPGWPRPGYVPSLSWPPVYPWEEIPRVRICPTAHEEAHVLRRWNSLSACNPIGPGAVRVEQLRPGPVPPDFALPFIDIGTNRTGMSGPIERDSGTISIHEPEAAGLLFCVEFECCCNLVQINHQIHGLWQIETP